MIEGLFSQFCHSRCIGEKLIHSIQWMSQVLITYQNQLKGLAEHLMNCKNRLHIFQFKRCHRYKRPLISPSELSSNHKDNLYVYNVPNFSNCFHIYCVIIHISSSGYLDMLNRQQGFITNKKEFYCNFLDKIDFHCDEYQESIDSLWNVLIISSIFSIIKILQQICQKAVSLKTVVETSKLLKPQGL